MWYKLALIYVFFFLGADVRFSEGDQKEDVAFEGWLDWDKQLKAKERVKPEVVPTFEEFSHDERAHREAAWKDEQGRPSPAPTEPWFRGWLEGKPNPVLPDDAALFPRMDRPSESGTQLAAMFPGGFKPGETYPVPDPALMPPPRRPSHTDRSAEYPPADKGTSGGKLRASCGVWLLRLTAKPVFWKRVDTGLRVEATPRYT